MSTEHVPQQQLTASSSGGQVPSPTQRTNLPPPPSQPTNPSRAPDGQIYIDHELDALLNSLLDEET